MQPASMAKPVYAINTFSYIWQRPAADCIRHLVGQGYTRFEILLTAPHLWPSEARRAARQDIVKLLMRDAAKVVSLNAGGFDNNLVSPAIDVREFAQRYLLDAIDLAADLNAGHVVMSPGVARALSPPPQVWLLGWFREGIEKLARRAETRGVRLLLENVPFAFLPLADDLMMAIEGLPVDSVGIIYDVANAVYCREDPCAGLTRVAERLHLVHLSDTPLETWRHDAIGRGVVPFRQFGEALRDIRYKGDVVLEIVSTNPDDDIRQSIEALGGFGWHP